MKTGVRLSAAITACLVVSLAAQGAVSPKGTQAMDSVPHAHWRFGGEIGARVDANIANWLLRAPGANPGLIEMFHRRDRHWPYAEPVPWAGEFAGKYLLAAVQAVRMTDDPRVKPFVQAFVDALVAAQAEDGYLGPWRENERLLGHWDLWGHYHCMLGLLMWYDETGDEEAYTCALRAADRICETYHPGGRRPIEAGTPMINLSVVHVMALLYQRTGDQRYWDLIQLVVEDMEKDGDWLREGANGTPYFKLPGGGTRWESLHIVQGLVELYRITGEDRYKTAAVNLWTSIRDFDRHPSGAFSTNEQAFGSVYERGSIETCCSVAWEALTIDILKLTGDAKVADELELTTWNQVLGAQHPSGNWWTYDTPLDGIRAPSYQQINFQYRPGTPELNCCSVNAPRGLGMLSEWAAMRDGDAIVINFYGPCAFDIPLPDGKRLRITEETDYPLDGKVALAFECEEPLEFVLKLRIPEHMPAIRADINGFWTGPWPPVPGGYLHLERTWTNGDRLTIEFDLTPRVWAGKGPRYGRAAVYHGPVLLAFDAFYNAIETADMKPIDATGPALAAIPQLPQDSLVRHVPIGLWQVETVGGGPVVLCDFASAGAHGTEYAAWLPAVNLPPVRAQLELPREGEKGRPGPVLLCWSTEGARGVPCEAVVARDARFDDVVARIPDLTANHTVLDEALLEPGTYYWKVCSISGGNLAENEGGPRTFTVDPGAQDAFFAIGRDGVLFSAPLDGNGAPDFGRLEHQASLEPAPDRTGRAGGAVAFNGKDSGLRYALPFFPEDAYTFCAWIYPEALPAGTLQQVFSAWCQGMDDPLRVTLRDNGVFAGIEMGHAYATPVVPLAGQTWAHVAAVKAGPVLRLYVNGQEAATVAVPERIATRSTLVGLGFNPKFSGGEHFTGRIDGAAFHASALSAEDILARVRQGE